MVHTRHPEIGFADAALREIVVKGVVIGLAGSFTFGLAVVLDLLWPLWDAQSRAGHDFLASTRVVDTVEAR